MNNFHAIYHHHIFKVRIRLVDSVYIPLTVPDGELPSVSTKLEHQSLNEH